MKADKTAREVRKRYRKTLRPMVKIVSAVLQEPAQEAHGERGPAERAKDTEEGAKDERPRIAWRTTTDEDEQPNWAWRVFFFEKRICLADRIWFVRSADIEGLQKLRTAYGDTCVDLVEAILPLDYVMSLYFSSYALIIRITEAADWDGDGVMDAVADTLSEVVYRIPKDFVNIFCNDCEDEDGDDEP